MGRVSDSLAVCACWLAASWRAPRTMLLLVLLVPATLLRHPSGTVVPQDTDTDGVNVTLSLLQITRTGNTSNDELRAQQLAMAEVDRGGVDIIAFPAGYLRGNCDRKLNWYVALSRTTSAALVVTCEEQERSQVVLLQSRGDSPYLMRLRLERGALPAINASLRLPRTSSAVVTTRDGLRGINVGIVMGGAAMNHAMAPRSLMLVGNELIINPVEQNAVLTDRDDDVLMTRGFENAAAVVRVASKGTALANWCNDMVEEGCSHGQLMVARAPASLDGAFRASFNLSELRAQRDHTIWGDAFRRPFQYQQICGFGLLPSRSAQQSHRSTKALGGAAAERVRVGMLQLRPCTSKADCLAHAVVWLTKAHAAGVDIALLPEMWSVGYGAQWRYISTLRALAQEMGMAIAATLMEADSAGHGPPFNAVVLIDRNGSTQYVYRKVHTCAWAADEAMTAPGRRFYTASVDLGSGRGSVNVGSMICADREFPEAARQLAMQGAELLLVPNACSLVPAQIRQFRTRAIENVAAVAMANFATGDGNGLSCAFDHEGKKLAEGATETEELVVADIDLASLRRARETERGRLLLAQPAAPEICELARQKDFRRANVFGRVGATII